SASSGSSAWSDGRSALRPRAAPSSSTRPWILLRFPSAAPPGPVGRSPPKTRGVRDGELRRVLGVQPHVLLAKIAGPHAVLAAAEPQVDRDVVFRPFHDLLNPLQTHTFLQHSPLDQALLAEGDRDLLLVDTLRALAELHHDAAPVRVVAVDGGLDERRVRHA